MAAFADATVALEKTENGAEAVVTTKDEKQIKKLHAFFENLNASTETSDEKGE
jgi:hypothetical protein